MSFPAPRFRPSEGLWSRLFEALATSVANREPASLEDPKPTDAVDYAAVVWLATARPALASGLDADAFQCGLLEQLAVGQPDVADNARRSVIWIAVDIAVRALLGSALSPGSGTTPADEIAALCRRFPGLVHDLQDRQRGRPPVAVHDEYDVQDLLFALLRVHFPDIRREETTPSHGGLRPRIDFLLKDARVAVETKMTRDGLDQRKLAEEIAVDKQSYRAHPDVRTAVFYIYDPHHRVKNVTALESDLSGDDGALRSIVIVTPTL